MQRRVGLYLRVSTGDQTVSNQRRELEAVCRRHGWRIVGTYSDNGISGRHGRDKRPGYDRLLTGVARREFDVVAAWSVDRLGRSLRHLLDFIEELKAKGVDLYLHQQGVDTSTPAGKALFSMCGVFAEFERSMIGQRVRAGLARAKAAGVVLGRPKISAEKEDAIRRALRRGLSVAQVARKVDCGRGTVARVRVEGLPGNKPPHRAVFRRNHWGPGGRR